MACLRTCAVAFLLLCPLLSGGPADITVDLSLVNITCSVTSRDNKPVTTLHREDFQLTEDSKPQPITHFGTETDLPLTIGLLVDVSGSQAGFVKQYRQAVEQFLTSVMAPRDKAFLVTFGHNIRLLQDTTGSVDDLKSALASIGTRNQGGELFEPSSKRFAGTRLWDAVFQASRARMQQEKGRKALIVFTDGLDMHSAKSLTDAIEAAQGADTLVYSIRSLSKVAIGFSLVSPLGAARLLADHGLARLSTESGGIEFSRKKPELGVIFDQIERELRTLYVLGYTPPRTTPDGNFHRIGIRTTHPELVVRARAGYFAR